MSIKVVSPKAELTVLRGLCHKDKKISNILVNGVDASYFYSSESKELFNSILQYIGEHGETPTYRLLLEDPDLTEEARTHMRDSQAAISTPEEANKAVKILNKYRQRRGIYEMGAFIADSMNKSKFDTDFALNKISEAITEIRSKKSSINAFTHFGKNNNSLQLINDILYGENMEKIIPTGFANFDDVSGGLARGGLFTIASTSGGGKSITSSQLAINIASLGYKVCVVPLEMSEWQMTARIMANVTGYELTPILQQKLARGDKEIVERKFRKWLKKVKNRGGRYSLFKPKEDMTLEDIYASTATFGFDVVIVDYISLLKGMDGDDMWRALGAAARFAKINAENMDRVNVLVCQLSDDGKIRYSRAITEHSSNSWVWHSDKEVKETGIIKVEQPKSRNSEAFPFYLKIHYPTMRVRDVKEDEAFQQGKNKEKDGSAKKDELPNLAIDD